MPRSVRAAAENARQRCGLRFLHRDVTSRLLVMTQAPQAGAPITVWVKRTDVTGARYAEMESLDPEQTVSKFIARWVAQAKLDMDPSLVTLRLVKFGAGKPTPTQEAEAKKTKKQELDDPSLKLTEVKVTGTAWLLAELAGAFALHACEFRCLCFY